MVESLCEIIYRSDDFRCGLFLGFCSVMLLYPDGGVGLSRGRCGFIQRAVWINPEGGVDLSGGRGRFSLWYMAK